MERAQVVTGTSVDGTSVGPPFSPVAENGSAGSAAVGTERILAETLAEVVSVDALSVDSHFFDDLGADSMVMARFCARVRQRSDLPAVSMKDIYQHSTIRSLATAIAPAAPSVPSGSSAPPVESDLAEVLAGVLGADHVSCEAHFFDDLGADSMVMARFCARVRQRSDLPAVSMKDIYQHSTVRGLASALAGPAPAASSLAGSAVDESSAPPSTREYVVCGALQFLLFVAFAYLAALVATTGFEWMVTSATLMQVYLRSLLFSAGSFLGLCTLPILAKWLIIGRWAPGQTRIWSLDYVRFWLVATLVRTNPLVLFVGSPLYPLYLRALGAKIGRDVAIFSRHVPVCTDLLTIGDGTVIRKDSFFTCYRAYSGRIERGSVTLGKDVVVGEASVVDIETSLGDAAQLAHSSALHRGQVVPTGEYWHGSPAQRAHADRRTVDPARCSTLRKVVYTVLQLVGALAVVLPLTTGLVAILLVEVPYLATLVGEGPLAFTDWIFYAHVVVGSFVVFFGVVLLGLLGVFTLPRVLNLFLVPGRVYPLYGIHYWMHRAIARMTNFRFFTYLFGDSSYIVHYLLCLGYRMPGVRQTGSNFGLDVKHDSPYLSSVGSATMAADGLSLLNADFSSTSFRLSPVSIGAHNFLGNYIAYPAQGRTGANCLLATKVLVPTDGEIRENVGLLGSPSFEIPRSVQRDTSLDHLSRGEEFRRRLTAKNAHNAVTIALFLLVRLVYVAGAVLLALGAVDLYHLFGEGAVLLAVVLALPLGVLYSTLVERAAEGFRPLRPQCCSIYEPYFWWHERYWKLSTQPRLLVGTPFQNIAWRLRGVRIGRRVFDAGCIVMEKSMVAIGDDTALNEGSIIQCHSQEDGAFKSDRIAIGAGCTVGVGALVHYGVTMGDGASLGPNSFLMKGEEVPQRARWGGNPAGELREADQHQFA